MSRLLAWVFTFNVCADGIWQIYRRYFTFTALPEHAKARRTLFFLFSLVFRDIFMMYR